MLQRCERLPRRLDAWLRERPGEGHMNMCIQGVSSPVPQGPARQPDGTWPPARASASCVEAGPRLSRGQPTQARVPEVAGERVAGPPGSPKPHPARGSLRSPGSAHQRPPATCSSLSDRPEAFASISQFSHQVTLCARHRCPGLGKAKVGVGAPFARLPWCVALAAMCAIGNAWPTGRRNGNVSTS